MAGAPRRAFQASAETSAKTRAWLAVAAVRKPHRGQFQPGNPGGGRPLGSRNRLSEIALQMLGDDFNEHGKAVIEQVRRERPHHYLSVVASLLPRQLQVERTSPLGELSDKELNELDALLSALRARTVSELELNGTAIADNQPQSSPLLPIDHTNIK
jgi:hypothetical protein